MFCTQLASKIAIYLLTPIHHWQAAEKACVTDPGHCASLTSVFASRQVLGIAGVDKKHSEPTCIEKLENRYPVDAGRFHDDGLAGGRSCTPRQPGFFQPLQQKADAVVS
jgi:hypothetical protein